MPIKTFRGLIADNATDTIVLHTRDGSTGYKIVKFELMLYKPGILIQESVVEIHRTSPPAPTGIIDFSNQSLLAAGVLQGHDSSAYGWVQETIFDNVIFNQDIYVTHIDVDGTAPVNYYIELEQVKLDLNENTVATLQDIRNIES